MPKCITTLADGENPFQPGVRIKFDFSPAQIIGWDLFQRLAEVSAVYGDDDEEPMEAPLVVDPDGFDDGPASCTGEGDCEYTPIPGQAPDGTKFSRCHCGNEIES